MRWIEDSGFEGHVTSFELTAELTASWGEDACIVVGSGSAMSDEVLCKSLGEGCVWVRNRTRPNRGQVLCVYLSSALV